jgi:FkbM family methyltransferase
MNDVLLTTSKRTDPFKLFRVILGRLNHKLAGSHIKHYPQIAIFSFDHIGLSVNLDGRYEREALTLLRNYVESNLPEAQEAVALDIGANIGNHSLVLSELFKDVYAFEPNPITFELLKFNAKFVSDTKNIVPLNKGLGNKEETLNFEISPENIGSSCIVSNAEAANGNGRYISIDVERADKIEQLQNAAIALIKIDIEGYEIHALQGAEELIQKNRPVIVFEQGPQEIANGSSVTIDYLKALGYEFATLQKNFYVGEGSFSKLLGLLLRSVFGFQLRLVETKTFPKRFHEMIFAIPTRA